MMNPDDQRMVPAISRDVPKDGFDPWLLTSDTAGEFKMISGKETVQTYIQFNFSSGVVMRLAHPNDLPLKFIRRD
jgi:hypothetical protein